MAKATRPKDTMQLAKYVAEIATGDRPNDKSKYLPNKKKVSKKKG
jgi:hypothetical protein